MKIMVDEAFWYTFIAFKGTFNLTTQYYTAERIHLGLLNHIEFSILIIYVINNNLITTKPSLQLKWESLEPCIVTQVTIN